MSKISVALVIISVSFILAGIDCQAQDFKPMNSTSFAGAAKEKNPDAPKKKFSEAIILKHRTLFKALCDSIEKDGRKDVTFAMLDINAYKDESCLSCRPLLKAFASGCKPSRLKSAKKGEVLPTPSPIPKQREPNLEVISYTSAIFSEIADDAKNTETVEEILKGMDRLTAVLTAEEGRSAAEREYFMLISDYANAPFKSIAKEAAEHRNELPKFGEGGQGASLDELFGR